MLGTVYCDVWRGVPRCSAWYTAMFGEVHRDIRHGESRCPARCTAYNTVQYQRTIPRCSAWCTATFGELYCGVQRCSPWHTVPRCSAWCTAIPGVLMDFPLMTESVGWLKCCFTSTETVGLLGTGAQDVHLDFDTAPEL